MRTGLLLVALVVTGTAHAAILCARPRSDGTFSTTVKLREACKGNEVELGIVTLQPLRLYGPTTTSTTSTTLPSCGTGLPPVGGVCWYSAGSPSETCNDVCAGVGRIYDDATRTFAGSDGTLANCRALFPVGTIEGLTDVSCSTGRGCGWESGSEGFVLSRCVTPATTAEAPGGGVVRRMCACS